jgi:HK97 family phage prohead protease
LNLSVIRSSESKPEVTGKKVKGYAAVWEKLSFPIVERGRKFQEKIAKNAFVLDDQPVTLFWNHNPDYPLASTPSTLSLGQDDHGLWFEADLPDEPGFIREALVRGVVRGVSWGSNDNKETWNEGVRTWTSIKVREISLAPMPYYPDTNVEVVRATRSIRWYENKLRLSKHKYGKYGS